MSELTLKPLTWPPARVDVHVAPDALSAMIKRVETNFRHMGETEPHWSVLTAEKFRAERIGTNVEEFYETGRETVQTFVATLQRCRLDPTAFRSCFELGCGVGRSTVWLAETFRSVVGSDISAPHLRIAAAEIKKRGLRNASCFQFDQIASISSAAPFDVFFSLIVLQHNPPPVIYAMLDAVFSRLLPGGVAYFQVPTYRFGYSFDTAAYLATPLRLGVPEMHVMPQPELHDLIAARGCRVIEMREDGAAGGDNISSRLLVRKL